MDHEVGFGKVALQSHEAVAPSSTAALWAEHEIAGRGRWSNPQGCPLTPALSTLTVMNVGSRLWGRGRNSSRGVRAVGESSTSRVDSMNAEERIGGIVLCGGRSSRMGQPKAWLPFGEQTMLQRVVDVLREVVDPVVVVAAPDQQVPPVPEGIVIVRDAEEGLGPLAGVAAGLEALAETADAAYVSSCDVPLLSAAFVRAVIERLGDAEIAIPCEDEWHHPLAAVYRTSLAVRCRDLIAGGQRRPLRLVQASRSNEFDIGELRAVDPELRSLRNANTPEEYELLLELASFADSHED